MANVTQILNIVESTTAQSNITDLAIRADIDLSKPIMLSSGQSIDLTSACSGFNDAIFLRILYIIGIMLIIQAIWRKQPDFSLPALFAFVGISYIITTNGRIDIESVFIAILSVVLPLISIFSSISKAIRNDNNEVKNKKKT